MEKERNFMVGMSKEDITPKLGSRLFAYSFERYAERVLDRLMVSVVAIRQENETVLFVSADLCLLSVDKCEAMRKTVAQATGVKWENIIFSVIHTHSSPVTKPFVGWGDADIDYLDNILVPAVIKAATKAIAQMQPALMGVGISETMAGVNRRQMNENGQVILGQNPDGPYDPTMTLIHFKAVTGENIGSIIHFAAHPTSAGCNYSFTRDWPGLMIDRINKITGAPCMYINGAEGDVGPRLSNGRTTGGSDENYVIQIGLVAADDAEKAYYNINTYEVPTMKVAYGSILLPYVKPPAKEEVEKNIKMLESEPDELKGVRRSQYVQLQKVKAVYDSGEQFPDEMELQQTVVTLGDLALVPACFEAFCNISLGIKEKSPYKNTILLGLTGGCYGYLPTEDQIPIGGYDVDSFRTEGIVSLVDDTDKHLIRQNVELLEKMYEESR
ncbi:MAG: neutral/alkaline non-lysosomal ceramidase N-terminal domain-containing protein [Lachnospiraceae bacterium]|nr:neutral/alkaline non-lysosomal ceramidase N-terminal domain-containing protein [Lachnospiraceae bacterium]